MIEKIILDHLTDNLDVPVSLTKQSNIESYVLIEKIGSSVINRIHRDTFAVQSYGGDIKTAINLNESVKKTLTEELIKDNRIASVKCINDYNFTDTTTKQYRYQAEFDITNYKTP